MKSVCVGSRSASKIRSFGFTLIEVLIVVAVISILAMILLPVFAQARARARTASCASNMRQIHTALLLYVADNDGFYPRAGYLGHQVDCSWVDFVYPYTKSVDVWKCPSAPRGDYQPTCAETEMRDGVPYFHSGSYFLNGSEDNRGTNATNHESNFQRPSETLLLAEALTGNPVGGVTALATDMDLEHSGLEARHYEGTNICFVDGHIKWLRYEKLKDIWLWRLGDK